MGNPRSRSVAFGALALFTVPANVTSILLDLIAGGGGGGGAFFNANNNGAGGGGAGEWCRNLPVAVIPGEVCTIVIGQGGAGETTIAQGWGFQGQPSSFTCASGVIQVQGGWGGFRQDIGSLPLGMTHPRSHGGTGAGAGGDGGGLGGLRKQLPASGNTTGGNLSTAGRFGTSEGRCFFGGGGGGGGGTVSQAGATCEGWNGGPHGTTIGSGATVSIGGAGGASSPWGVGGSGGTLQSAPLYLDRHGFPPSIGAYGAGGGGGASSVATGLSSFGGPAMSGYCVITWIEQI